MNFMQNETGNEKLKNTATASAAPVDLKDPYAAMLLSFVFPGLGHFYQGRIAKGVLFALCVGGLFLLGAYLGSSKKFGPCRVVYFTMARGEERYYYFAQMWIGLPAAPALVQYMLDRTGESPILGGLMAPPVVKKVARETDGGAEILIHDSDLPTAGNIREYLNRSFELGTIFTVAAGLLNLFVVLDAYAGPVPEEEEEEDEKKKAQREQGPAKNAVKDAAQSVPKDAVKK